MVTKAMKVEEAYYNAAADKATLKSCHRHAVSTALNLGGIVIDNPARRRVAQVCPKSRPIIPHKELIT